MSAARRPKLALRDYNLASEADPASALARHRGIIAIVRSPSFGLPVASRFARVFCLSLTMKTLCRYLIACVLSCWSASTCGAQVAEPVPAPGTTRAAEDEPWAFSVGLYGTYEGNLLFIGPDPTDEFSNQLRATLNRSWKMPRGGASLYGAANQPFYQDTTSLDDFRYDVGGALSYAITRRLQWAGSGSASSGLARDNQALTETGVLLPSVTARSSSATSMFSYALSRDSQLSWSLAENGVGFSSILFRGGTNLSSVVSWTTRVGRSQTVGVTQDYQRTFGEGVSANNYGFLGTWSMTAGRDWSLYATGGVRPYTVPNEGGYRLSGTYSAGVTKPVQRNQTVGISFLQTIEQTFGFLTGTRLVDSVSGNYSFALHRNLSASVSGIYTYGKDPQTPDLTFTAQIAQASLDYRFARNWSLGFGSTYYSRVDEPIARVNSSSTFLALNYSTTW
jgi:hypothetical protein